MLPRPPRSPLFPYTTLFRSAVEQVLVIRDHHRRIALGKGVHRVAPTEDGEHRLVETPQVHAGAREIRRQIEHRSEEHTSELQSHSDLVCRLLLEKKKKYEKK